MVRQGIPPAGVKDGGGRISSVAVGMGVGERLELTRRRMGGRDGVGQPRYSAWAFSGQKYMQETQAHKGGRDPPETHKYSLGGAEV